MTNKLICHTLCHRRLDGDINPGSRVSPTDALWLWRTEHDQLCTSHFHHGLSDGHRPGDTKGQGQSTEGHGIRYYTKILTVAIRRAGVVWWLVPFPHQLQNVSSSPMSKCSNSCISSGYSTARTRRTFLSFQDVCLYLLTIFHQK